MSKEASIIFFNIRIKSEIACKISKDLSVDDVIFHLHKGFDIEGIVSKRTKENIELYQSNDLMKVELIADDLLIVTAYSDIQEQKWYIYTNFATNIRYRLVKKYNLLCDDCDFNNLFD